MDGFNLATELGKVVTALTTAFTTTDLMTVVTVTIGGVAIYLILWFGVRYVAKRVVKAIFGGRLHV